MGSENEQIHIVMLPFMAHGHLIPFLALARQIHHRTGFNITIANTPLNIQYLRATLHQDEDSYAAGIHLAELPFNSAHHGLPPNVENTENLPLNQIGKLLTSSPSLQNPFHRLLIDIIDKQAGKPPLCIISDTFFGWVADVAKSTGTVNISFATGGAYGTLAYSSLWLNLPRRQTDSEEFSLPGFPERCRFHVSQLHEFMRKADGNDPWSRFMQAQIKGSLKSFGWLCNTVEEIEPLGLESLRNHTKFPIWTIGPLLPKILLNKSLSSSCSSLYRHRAGKKPGICPEKCTQWLDMHGDDSVLYISFGSQNTVSPSQMRELAIGLEGSGNPFIWVIRPPLGFDLKAEFRAEWLPQGFEERMSKNKQGMLVKNWAPQLVILSHKSTGAFLSHCGWNSTLESLSQGVKMMGWPMAAEQAYNSKMLVEELGVSVELTRGMQSTIVGEEVRRVIRLVMDKQGKGGYMKKKAEEIAQLMREAVQEEEKEKGSSIKALDDFVSAIISRNQRASKFS